MSEKYFLDNLQQHSTEIGGHYRNRDIFADWLMKYDRDAFPKYVRATGAKYFATDDGNTGVILHIFENIGIEFQFALDIGAYSVAASNITPVVIKYAIDSLLLDAENKHQDKYISKEWVTKENVCSILQKYHTPKNLDLISLDIDNMDYWVLKALLEGGYRSNLLIAEFNPVFCHDEGFTKQYIPDAAKKSGLDTMGSSNYGASLKAITDLTGGFGYRLIHVMSTQTEPGNNAIFLQSRFDPEDKFEDQSKVLQSLHPVPFVESHKSVANRQKFETDDLEVIRGILKNQFKQI